MDSHLPLLGSLTTQPSKLALLVLQLESRIFSCLPPAFCCWRRLVMPPFLNQVAWAILIRNTTATGIYPAIDSDPDFPE
jgi:hypothetical protein